MVSYAGRILRHIKRLNMRSGWLYGLIFFSLISSAALAQQRNLITGNFSNFTFTKFVDAIESQTNYHFYYDPLYTDSLTINIVVENKTINKVLDEVFAGTNFHYAIDQFNTIYITHVREIFTRLPTGFFGSDSSGAKGESKFDYSAYEKRELQSRQAENKVYVIGIKTNSLQGRAVVSGIIRDIRSGEPIIGATISSTSGSGVISDQLGNFSISLPKGRNELKIQSVGMKKTTRQIMLYSDGKLNIELEETITSLKEVVIESDRDKNVTGLQMGVQKLDIKTMKNMPSVLGETDIMKVILTLPGVQTVGEGTIGMNVRGGATNQNLILFNNATVYNPSHLFGFFSTFNPDVLKSVELYKSGITADYGGRLSSVLDVTSREGNFKKFSGSGGISPVTGRLVLEGPIIKERTSFLIGARSTYSDWLLHQLNSYSLRNSQASFYDLNANLSHKINDRNQLFFSAYASRDHFKLNSDTAYSYSDRNASIRWKHNFNSKLYGVFTGGYSNYTYSISSDKNPVEAFNLDFNIKQLSAKADFTYFLNPKHTLNGGVNVVRYGLAPGNQQPLGTESKVVPNVLQNEQGLETAIYMGDNIEVSPHLSLYLGLRYSFYQYQGPKDVNIYASGVPRDTSTIQQTIHYGSGSAIASYGGPEPRISMRYSVSKNSSVKLSYNRMRQYIQTLSNTTAIAPTDIWKLSDAYIKPQIGDQVSIGYYKNLEGGLVEMSIEGYYKTTQNTIDYKGGATLVLNHNIETDVVSGNGKAYGIEFLIKKSEGKLNGWISYTYSRSFLQSVGDYPSEAINKGAYYPSNYDKPHAFNFIGNYKINRRFNFSLNVTYSTGRPITLPLQKYEVGGTARLYYSDRNQERIPDYFRTDISINVEGNHKIKKLAHSSWTFAVYNLTGRKNAYSVYYTSENGIIKGYKLSIFAQAIPTITYNFRF
jgi:hypothetical protein